MKVSSAVKGPDDALGSPSGGKQAAEDQKIIIEIIGKKNTLQGRGTGGVQRRQGNSAIASGTH